jgi:hypothetical protein
MALTLFSFHLLSCSARMIRNINFGILPFTDDTPETEDNCCH